MIIQSVAGLFVFPGIAWLIGENRKHVRIKLVIVGIAVQLAIGILLLKLPVCRRFFISLNHLVLALEASTKAGTTLVFGYLGGMGTMAPEKRDEIVSLGFRSVIAGTLATCMTGAVIGIIG
jgi:nucleoside permease NupC